MYGFSSWLWKFEVSRLYELNLSSIVNYMSEMTFSKGSPKKNWFIL